MAIRKAVASRCKARIGLSGPSGSGKTYTSVSVATSVLDYLKEIGEIDGNGRVGLIDTEHRSAEKTAARDFDFDVADLYDFSHTSYIKQIDEFENEGYSFLIIDSLSHEWMGKNGMLEQHARATEAHKKNDSFACWAQIGPLHNSLIDRILRSNMHIICTLRAKTKHVRNGGEITKVGLRPVTREGTEYEFDINGMMRTVQVANKQGNDTARSTCHKLIIDKSRFKDIDGMTVDDPGREFGVRIARWLSSGAKVAGGRDSRPTLPPDRIAKIQDMRAELGVPADQFLKALTKYHVSRVEDLSMDDSEVIIRNLEEKVRAKRVKETREGKGQVGYSGQPSQGANGPSNPPIPVSTGNPPTVAHAVTPEVKPIVVSAPKEQDAIETMRNKENITNKLFDKMREIVEESTDPLDSITLPNIQVREPENTPLFSSLGSQVGSRSDGATQEERDRAEHEKRTNPLVNAILENIMNSGPGTL